MSELIKGIASGLGCSYLYDDWGRINQRADQIKKFPLICEVMPAEGSIDIRRLPMTQVTRTTVVAFLMPCDFDFKGCEVGDIIDHMLVLCGKFLARYAERASVTDMGDTIAYNAVLDFMDANLCGVRITLPMAGEDKCNG